MNKIVDYVKRHWLILFLLLIIVILLNNRSSSFSSNSSSLVSSPVSRSSSLDLAEMMPSSGGGISQTIPPSDSPDRLIITNTSLSLVVNNVSESIKNIQTETQKLGGFLVNSYLSQPESAASGNITVRVPEDKRDQALMIFKQISSKVISESVSGNDVTDQYVDIQSRLEVLVRTKAKFEDIMSKAYSVTDLLTVQRELINLQTQIDSLKGQEKYYEQSAKLSKITVYLSTDALSLPYAPTNEWRPIVILKEAIRSLLTTLRGVAGFIIWIVVYLPIILPIFLIVRYLKRRTNLK